MTKVKSPKVLQNQLSFSSPGAVLEKLGREVMRIQKTGQGIQSAEQEDIFINACITAWSLVEWVKEHHPELSETVHREAISNVYLRVVRHVADAFKHGGINRDIDPTIGFESPFEVGTKKIAGMVYAGDERNPALSTGMTLCVLPIKALDFWEDYFMRNHIAFASIERQRY